jgi:hypothetical protein
MSLRPRIAEEGFTHSQRAARLIQHRHWLHERFHAVSPRFEQRQKKSSQCSWRCARICQALSRNSSRRIPQRYADLLAADAFAKPVRIYARVLSRAGSELRLPRVHGGSLQWGHQWRGLAAGRFLDSSLHAPTRLRSGVNSRLLLRLQTLSCTSRHRDWHMDRPHKVAAQPHHMEALGNLKEACMHPRRGKRHLAQGSTLAVQIHPPHAHSPQEPRVRFSVSGR